MPEDLPADAALEQPAPAEPVAGATGAEPADTAVAADVPASGAGEASAAGVTAAGGDAPEVVPPAPAPEAGSAPSPGQSSLAAPAPPSRGLSYAVDIAFCIDVTGSRTPILDAVKTNALRFYEHVQTNLTAEGKVVDELRVRVIAFRDLVADGEAALDESPFFALPGEQAAFSDFVGGLIAEGGGDAPESGPQAVSLAINSDWTTRGDRRRQVVVVWTDQPAHPLDRPSFPPSCSPACRVTSAP